MSRLITIGCSLTQYDYPTWADMAGTHFEEHYNLGNPGCGHNYMLNIFTEADILLNLGEGDTVIVMSTSFVRYDVWLPNGDWGWQGNGNVYVGMPQEFLKNFYSDEHNLMQSFSCLKSIYEICKSKKINFILLKGFPTDFNNHYYNVDVEFFDNQINELFNFKNYPSLKEFTEEQMGEYKGYEWQDQDGKIDQHPTMLMHHRYLKKLLPQYSINEDYLNLLEQRIDLSSKENNIQLFDDVKGKKLGSLITRNFSNDYMKNFKYSG